MKTIHDLIRVHGDDDTRALIEHLIGAVKHDAHNALPSDDHPFDDDDAVQAKLEAAMAYWEEELWATLRAIAESAMYDVADGSTY